MAKKAKSGRKTVDVICFGNEEGVHLECPVMVKSHSPFFSLDLMQAKKLLEMITCRMADLGMPSLDIPLQVEDDFTQDFWVGEHMVRYGGFRCFPIDLEQVYGALNYAIEQSKLSNQRLFSGNLAWPDEFLKDDEFLKELERMQ